MSALFSQRDPSRPLIHFAHANGIPSPVYTPLLADLQRDHDVVTLPEIGTDPRYPVTNHWPRLVDQLMDSVASQSGGEPVIGLGHSLGSLLTLMAAYRRPELFRQVIMLDPPLITGPFSLFFHLAKHLHPPTADRITPAGLSAKRRDHWDSRAQAAEKLRGKGLFASWQPAFFDAYIQHGLKDDPRGGVTLTIPREVEVAVFRHNPSWWWLKPWHPPQVPVLLLAGQDSLFYQRGLPQWARFQMGIPYTLMKGGHMFPMEYPEETLARIRDVIATPG